MEAYQTAEHIVDQRRYPRVPFGAVAQYELADGRQGTARVANLGSGGFALRTGWGIDPGTPIALRLGSDCGLVRPTEFLGRVCWAQRARSWQWNVGVELHDDEWELHPGMDDLVRAALRQAQEEPHSPAANAGAGWVVGKNRGSGAMSYRTLLGARR